MAKGEEEIPFIYFEAKPKRGNYKVVDQTIFEMMALFSELYEYKANCNMHTEQKGHQWTILITYEKAADRDLMNDSERFQELLTNIRAFCKPANRLRRKLYPIMHPGKHLGGYLASPVSLPRYK